MASALTAIARLQIQYLAADVPTRAAARTAAEAADSQARARYKASASAASLSSARSASTRAISG